MKINLCLALLLTSLNPCIEIAMLRQQESCHEHCLMTT